MYEDSNFRIVKHPKGWISEIRKPRWTLFGIKWKWTHYISVAGMSDKAWYFKSREFAEKETLLYIKRNMIEQSR